jgi:dsRNA-specific ribonuclease
MQAETIQKYVHFRLSPFFSGKALDDISNSKLFELAFTHPSYDEKNNFEYLEFRGDAVANLAIAQYIRIRFPSIKSAKWLNKLNLALHSTSYMSIIAKKEGFQNYVRLGKNHKIISSLDKDELMEDLLESFCGAVLCYCDEHFEVGSGYAIVFSIISTFFERHIGISLDEDYGKFFDIKSRVKEMVESNTIAKPKWEFNKGAKIVRIGSEGHVRYDAYYDIYPKGDKSPTPENKITLKATAKTEGEVEIKIYELVLAEMKKFGLEESKCDPYQNDFYNKYNKEETPVISKITLLTPEFRKSMKAFLKRRV